MDDGIWDGLTSGLASGLSMNPGKSIFLGSNK